MQFHDKWSMLMVQSVSQRKLYGLKVSSDHTAWQEFHTAYYDTPKWTNSVFISLAPTTRIFSYLLVSSNAWRFVNWWHLCHHGNKSPDYLRGDGNRHSKSMFTEHNHTSHTGHRLLTIFPYFSGNFSKFAYHVLLVSYVMFCRLYVVCLEINVNDAE